MLLPVHDVSCRTLNEIPMGLQPAAAGGASTVPRTRARPLGPERGRTDRARGYRLPEAYT